MPRIRAILCAVIVLAAGCSTSSNEPTTEAGSPTAETTATPDPTTQPVDETPEPDAPAEMTLDEVLDLFVGWVNGEPLTEEDYEELLSEEFRAQVPYDPFVATFDTLAPGRPYTVLESEQTATEVEFVLEASDGSLLGGGLAWIDGELAGALIRPIDLEIPANAEEAIADLDAQGTLHLVRADTTSGACDVLDGRSENEIMPLGSVFKLYVLGALVDAVEAGTLRWDDPVTIRDELDSLPSGTTQSEPDGSTATVQELASLMISISDNTATDHLIDLLGREVVEAAQAGYGMAEPELNQPFLTTRDLFVLKVGEPTLQERWLAGDADSRRELLENDVAAAPLPTIADAVEWSTMGPPIAIDELEWFATPLDICRILVSLWADDTARQILTISPGIPDTADRWAEIGFKGGSEAGVLAVSWISEDRSGQTFVVAGAVANEDEVLDEASMINAFAVLRETVGE